jgi:hypothetical protein
MPKHYTATALETLDALHALGDAAFDAAADATDLDTFQAQLTATRDALRDRAQGNPSLAPALEEAEANLLAFELEVHASSWTV